MLRKPWLVVFRLLCCAGLVVAFASCEDEDTDVKDVPAYQSVDRGQTLPPVETQSTTTTNGADLAISPSSADLEKDGDMASFTVSGGTAPYSFSVSDVFRGSIVDAGGKKAVYQRTSAGDNSVIARDSKGSRAYAVVNQP